jgi:prefoldin beta subunit
MTSEKISKDTQEKLTQIQMYQQRLQIFAGQKQQFQIQQIEIDSALTEVSKTKKPVYVLVGGIMVERPVAEIKKELQSKKNELNIQIKNIEKQETSIQKKAESLQKELTKILK